MINLRCPTCGSDVGFRIRISDGKIIEIKSSLETSRIKKRVLVICTCCNRSWTQDPPSASTVVGPVCCPKCDSLDLFRWHRGVKSGPARLVLNQFERSDQAECAKCGTRWSPIPPPVSHRRIRSPAKRSRASMIKHIF